MVLKGCFCIPFFLFFCGVLDDMGGFIYFRRFHYWWRYCICIFSVLISANAFAVSGIYTTHGLDDPYFKHDYGSIGKGRGKRKGATIYEDVINSTLNLKGNGWNKPVPFQLKPQFSTKKLALTVGKRLALGGVAGWAVGQVWDKAMSDLDFVLNDKGNISKQSKNLPDNYSAPTPLSYKTVRGIRIHGGMSSAPSIDHMGLKVVEVRLINGRYNLKSCGFNWALPYTLIGYDGGSNCLYGTLEDSETLTESTGLLAPSPLTEKEIIEALDYHLANKATDPFLDQVLKDACSGSLVPDRCYRQHAEAYTVTGTDLVKGPTTTKTEMITASDGTLKEVQTKTDTNYKLDYAGNQITVTENKSVTRYENGQKVGETQTTESTDENKNPETEPDAEAKPETETEAQAKPCTGESCNPPDYEQQFEEVDLTKEQVIDSYHQTILGAPIFQAVGDFFKISASSSCPVWEAKADFSVFGVTETADLTFDYHCQSWFAGLRNWAAAVFMVVATFIAFRIGVLD